MDEKGKPGRNMEKKLERVAPRSGWPWVAWGRHMQRKALGMKMPSWAELPDLGWDSVTWDKAATNAECWGEVLACN